jgi:hypothetical protein
VGSKTDLLRLKNSRRRARIEDVLRDVDFSEGDDDDDDGDGDDDDDDVCFDDEFYDESDDESDDDDNDDDDELIEPLATLRKGEFAGGALRLLLLLLLLLLGTPSTVDRRHLRDVVCHDDQDVFGVASDVLEWNPMRRVHRYYDVIEPILLPTTYMYHWEAFAVERRPRGKANQHPSIHSLLGWSLIMSGLPPTM